MFNYRKDYVNYDKILKKCILTIILSFIFSFFTTQVSASISCNDEFTQAPCEAVGLRKVIVASDGSGQYTQIQPALDEAKPGDDILIKPGFYANTGVVCGSPFITMRVSGTKEAPIYIGAYDPQNPPLITVDFQNGCNFPVIGGRWVMIENLHFTSVYNEGSGIRAFADNSTYSKNKFYNNKYQGLWQDGSHQRIVDNIFENNGNQGPNIGCVGNWEGKNPPVSKWDPSHCHGIYGGTVYPPISTQCRTPHHVTIERNLFKNNSGSGYQVYINPTMCKDPVRGRKVWKYLIQNNVFEDNAYAFFIVGFEDSTIRNNTIIQRTYPIQTTNRSIGFLDWFDVKSTVRIYNNIFLSLIPANPPGTVLYLMSSQIYSDNFLDMDYNMYFVKANAPFRRHDGTAFRVYSSFLTQWKSATGKDSNSTVYNVDNVSPKFVNLMNGDYRLLQSSPLIQTGHPTDCPLTDFYGNIRKSGRCTIGAFEFFAVGNNLSSPFGLQVNP